DEVSRPHPDCLQRDPQGVRPAPDPDGVGGAAVGRKPALEVRDSRTTHERRPLDQIPPPRFDFGADLLMHAAQIKERDAHDPLPTTLVSASTRAGTPATTAPSGTSLVTTAPAPTTAPSPIVTPGMMIAPVPMAARCFTRMGSSVQSLSCLIAPASVAAAGYRSFRKLTLCPTNTSSSIVTPSQMNV